MTNNVTQALCRFIKKVFGIVSVQLLLTATVALALMLNPSTQQYLASSLGWQVSEKGKIHCLSR